MTVAFGRRAPTLHRGAGEVSGPAVWCDFNDLGSREKDHLHALHQSGVVLEPGERVLVGDYEGNSCFGTVIKSWRAPTGGRLYYHVKVDTDTWQDGP